MFMPDAEILVRAIIQVAINFAPVIAAAVVMVGALAYTEE